MARRKTRARRKADAIDERLSASGANTTADLEREAGNHHNGTSTKAVLTDREPVVLDIPRDRHGRFDPALIRKYQRRFPASMRKSSRSTLAA